MDKRRYCFSKKLLWVAMMVEIAILSTATNITTTESPQDEVPVEPVEIFAWTAWSGWSPCSRSCGGGVSVQERQCLPRTNEKVKEDIDTEIKAENTSISPPAITVRVTREAHPHCEGVNKRFHECNIQPCPGGVKNSRAEQCASYDRRPFRGRFYTWVPYIDGNSPCTLNCRPMGQHFYASLSLVADGSPCTLQGSRAICVQGACKVSGQHIYH